VLNRVIKTGGQPDVAFRALDKKLKSLFVSAYQSQLFNRLLADRIAWLDRIEDGDVAYIHGKGAAFIVDNAAREQPRVDNFEISPSGPLFGPKMLQAKGEPGQREEAVLAKEGLTNQDFRIPGLKVRGGRRPYRIGVKAAKVWWDEGLMVSFELEPGAYATTVMAEVMKQRQ
jgi:tRNA pseudouridine13 synthase